MGPEELILYPNNECNHQCYFCKRQLDGVELELEQMKLSLIKQALNKYSAIDNVGIAGFAEPLLWDHLGDATHYLNNKVDFVSVITNGSLIHKNMKALKPVDQLSVSLNATTREKHHNVTGRDNFNQITGNIEKALQELKTVIGVSFVVTKENFKEIPQFISLASSLDVNFIDLHNILPHQDISKKDNTDDFLDLAITKSDKSILGYIESLKPHPLVRSWPTPISPSSCPHQCNSPFMSMGLDTQGNISGCRRIMEPKEKYGTLEDGGWEEEQPERLREAMKNESTDGYPCNYCFGAWSG